MAENHEPGKWDAVVCSGFAAVNVLSSTNVEELGWDYTEMELDPTGTCGLFDGMLLDWDDDTPEERREHEEFFPDAFTVGARILADDWDHEIGNEKKPEVVVAAKPDPVELGHRASVAAGSTAGGRARGAGIRQ